MTSMHYILIIFYLLFGFFISYLVSKESWKKDDEGLPVFLWLLIAVIWPIAYIFAFLRIKI